MLSIANILAQIEPLLPDSVPSKAQELSTLKQLPLDEFLNRVVTSMVSFSINLTIAIIVFIVGKFIINKIHKLITSVLLRRRIDRSLATFVLSLVRIVLFFILIVTVIGIIGIETSSFLAIFASAGVAIGMALSGTLQNFAGGVLILLLKPYKVGDYIEVNGYAGTVMEIQIFNTVIVTPDNKSVIIPNGGLSTGSIKNYSRETYRRVDWTVAISYGDDVDAARAAILEILNADERVVSEFATESERLAGKQTNRQPVVYVAELADSSVNLTIRAWTRNENYWSLFFDMNEIFYKQLPLHGINFPFPQLDVHMQK